MAIVISDLGIQKQAIPMQQARYAAERGELDRDPTALRSTAHWVQPPAAVAVVVDGGRRW